MDVVVTGHVDHGKSTLIGRLLYDSQALPGDKLAEIQKLLEEYKKRFEFAYFLDSFEEELMEERTIDTTRVLFKGQDYYTIVDVPGHKEFIRNMLTGASQAQAAILVVSAPDGVQEQTRRHAFLLKMLGIKHVLVAINKMDLVSYQEEAFKRVKNKTAELLGSMGYEVKEFIPISALEGENVYKASVKMAWYKGMMLIEALDRIEPEEVSEKPLRLVVQDTYTYNDGKATVGRVESGIIERGDRLVFQPSGVEGKVNKIIVFPEELETAQAGDSIGVVMGCEVARGNVGGHPEQPPVPVNSFLGEVVLLEGRLKKGEAFEMKCGTMKARCRVKDIKERISSETGEVIEGSPSEIGENEAATIIFETDPIVLERFSEIPELGRFVIAKKNRNVGAGVVLETRV